MRSLLRPSRRQLGALATLGTAFVLCGPAAPASATGATGTVDTHNTIDGVNVEIDNKELSTQLIPIRLAGGGRVLTYCIDFTTAARDRAAMVEDDWKNYPNPSTSFKAKPANVNWILQNSYPHLELDTLREASGVEQLDEREAIAATQLAIWHFSNRTEPGGSNDHDVLALYAYLTGAANTGLTAEPTPTLDLAPAMATGKAGSKIGPLTVRTTAKTVRLTFRGDSGATLTDASGAPVTEAANGTKLYVTVPAGAAAGKAAIEASVSAMIQTGRLFRGDGVETQTLITASNSPVEVDDRAAATWRTAGQPAPPTATPPAPTPTATPAPTETPKPSETPAPSDTPSPSGSADEGGAGGLPVTGFQTGVIAGVGVLLLGGGLALFFLSRRRKHA